MPGRNFAVGGRRECSQQCFKSLLVAATERFHERLPLSSGPINWHDAIETAFQLRQELGISQRSWAEACEVMGRAGAAVCIVVTDRALSREENPVRLPAAYFRGMIKKAENCRLKLHSSIYQAATCLDKTVT